MFAEFLFGYILGLILMMFYYKCKGKTPTEFQKLKREALVKQIKEEAKYKEAYDESVSKTTSKKSD